MPTYDYQCAGCGHRFENFQAMSSKPLRKCPECGRPKLKRLIGPGGGLLFKGSGFYITDYRSDSYKSAASSDSTSAPSTAKKSDDPTPSKAGESPPAPPPPPPPQAKPNKPRKK